MIERNRPAVLSGKDAIKFEEYQNRKGTPEEIEYMKRAEEYYLSHKPIMEKEEEEE